MFKFQVRAVTVGLDNLHIYDEEFVEQVQKTLNTNANYMDKSVKWRKGELEFEALMRMLDAQVRFCYCWQMPIIMKPGQGFFKQLGSVLLTQL